MNAYAQLIAPAQGPLFGHMAAAVAPRKTVLVSQCADNHRWLSGKASQEEGRYRTSRTPHLREIMDSLSSSSHVQRVTVKKPAQGGATEVVLNWILYVMLEAPGPMLAVLPTLELRKRWVTQRLEPMLQDCPDLARIFNSRKQRERGNSEDLKDFPGGMLILGGANSPASLSSMPIRYVVCDEVDRFPWEVGQEGDPLGLIDERTKAFSRRKVALVSTPTMKDSSRIDAEYEESDQRELFVPCPHCSQLIVLHWKLPGGELGLVKSETTGQVWYQCPSCGEGIEENSKKDLLNNHRWIPKHPERRLHRGYHWNGLYAPIGLGYSWREMLDQWVSAQNDSTKLKRFYNTGLGQVYEEEGEELETAALFSRREQYPDDLKFTLMVAFVDVQKDRLEMTVYGVLDHPAAAGKMQDEEMWGLDHVIMPGETTEADVWNDLADELDNQGVQACGIDAGYNTRMVNAFVEKRPWCAALKGVTGMNRPLVEDERKRRHRLRHRRRKGVPQEPVGVDGGKATIFSRLRKTKPGPGYIHYPDHPAFDEEFFLQLGAEKLVTKVKNGKPFSEWIKTRPRNEALDCAVGAMATYHLANALTIRPAKKTKTSTAKPSAAPVVVQQTDSIASDSWSDRL